MYKIQCFVVFSEGDSCEFGSAKYFALCGFGGVLSCGLTHTAVVPLDLVKCRIQVKETKYQTFTYVKTWIKNTASKLCVYIYILTKLLYYKLTLV